MHVRHSLASSSAVLHRKSERGCAKVLFKLRSAAMCQAPQVRDLLACQLRGARYDATRDEQNVACGLEQRQQVSMLCLLKLF